MPEMGEEAARLFAQIGQADVLNLVTKAWQQLGEWRRATAELMNRFYRLQIGEKPPPPSSALRAAQLEMMRSGRWPSPYFRAGFTLQGDYR